ncbi:MAG: hypothetical protein EZS28_046874, partial [Streblomastix strix]
SPLEQSYTAPQTASNPTDEFLFSDQTSQQQEQQSSQTPSQLKQQQLKGQLQQTQSSQPKPKAPTSVIDTTTLDTLTFSSPPSLQHLHKVIYWLNTSLCILAYVHGLLQESAIAQIATMEANGEQKGVVLYKEETVAALKLLHTGLLRLVSVVVNRISLFLFTSDIKRHISNELIRTIEVSTNMSDLTLFTPNDHKIMKSRKSPDPKEAPATLASTNLSQSQIFPSGPSSSLKSLLDGNQTTSNKDGFDEFGLLTGIGMKTNPLASDPKSGATLQRIGTRPKPKAHKRASTMTITTNQFMESQQTQPSPFAAASSDSTSQPYSIVKTSLQAQNRFTGGIQKSKIIS